MVDAAFFTGLVQTFGYFGVFLASAIGSATIIFPAPSFLIILAAGSLLNPVLVGIAAGLGAALGELTGYGVGYGAQRLAKKRPAMKSRWFTAAKEMTKRTGTFFAILIFAAAPLPFDIIGLLSGVLRYDVRRFLLATAIGKIVKFTFLAYAGYYGLEIFDVFF